MTREVIDTLGYTKGCPRCEAVRRGYDQRTVHHSRECTKRSEKEMTEDKAYVKSLGEDEERQNKHLVRQIEEAYTERRENIVSCARAVEGHKWSPIGV